MIARADQAILAAIMSLLVLPSCGRDPVPPDALSARISRQTKALADLKAENIKLRRQLEAEKADVAALREVYIPKSSADLPRHVDRSNSVTAERPGHAVSMCYKDYCPCDPPQEGMDMILCDKLESGTDVDVDLMIAGRGGREYRRQAAASAY